MFGKYIHDDQTSPNTKPDFRLLDSECGTRQSTRPEVYGFKQRRIIGDEELAKEHGPWAEHAMSLLSTCLLTTTTPSTVAPTKTRWPAVRNLNQAQQGFLHPTPDRARGLPAP